MAQKYKILKSNAINLKYKQEKLLIKSDNNKKN